MLVNLGTSLVTAVVSSIIAVKLALRRFYSEKWWEKKCAAYSSIMEAIHNVREHADTNHAFSLRGKELPAVGDEQLTKKLQEAMAELRKQRDIGSFVISKEAVLLLNELFASLDASTRTESWQEHLQLKLAAVDKCLPEFRRIAKNDLNLTGAA